MDYTDITNRAREQTGKSNSWSFSDANLLKYVNRRYHTIENQVKDMIAEDYFFNIFTAPTVAGQNEYDLKASASDAEWMSRVISVDVKWSSADDYYTLVNNAVIDWYTDDYLASNLSQDKGFYKIQDSSVFIYPTPTVSVDAWYRVKAIITQPDLSITSEETDIFPRHTELRQFHYVISLWVIADILGIDWKENEKNIAEQRFDLEVDKMLRTLWSRKYSSVEQTLPNLDFYKY